MTAALLAAVLSIGGCSSVDWTRNDAPLVVYGFENEDQKAGVPKHYQSALIDRRLENASHFVIKIDNLKLEKHTPTDDPKDNLKLEKHTPITDLKDNDFRSNCFHAPMDIRHESASDTLSIKVSLKSPFSYKGPESSPAESLAAWTRDCHCSDLKGALTGTSFKDRILNSILAEGVFEELSLSEISKRRIRAAAGDPVAGFDELLYTDRLLTLYEVKRGSTAYLAQEIKPGEKLCFQGKRGFGAWFDPPGDLYYTNEPDCFTCFPWQVLTRGHYRDNSETTSKTTSEWRSRDKKFSSVGTDPLGRENGEWKQGDSGRTTNGTPRRTDAGILLTDVDSITARDQAFRFALLFTKNQWFSIPCGPSWDLKIAGTETNDAKTGERGSFLMLFRDYRLMTYVRDHIQKGKKIEIRENIEEYIFGDKILKEKYEKKIRELQPFGELQEVIQYYLDEVTEKWMDSVGLPDSGRVVSDWMADIIIPVNARPFVRLPVWIDGTQTYVRSGTTLLNLIDQRIGLSAEVFKQRNDAVLDIDGIIEQASDSEAELVRKAVSRITYRRMFGTKLREIKLNRVQRLEDLMLSLKLGDRISWQN